MKVIEEKGGFIQCYKDGWVEDQVNEAGTSTPMGLRAAI